MMPDELSGTVPPTNLYSAFHFRREPACEKMRSGFDGIVQTSPARDETGPPDQVSHGASKAGTIALPRG